MLPAEGKKKQFEVLKGRSSEERLKSGFTLSQLAKKLCEDGIRNQHPALAEAEIKKLLLSRINK